MKKLTFILLFLSLNLLAQDMNPKPINNNDLREGKTIFSWNYNDEILSLVLQGDSEYHLIKDSGKVTKKLKISTSEAESLDRDFVAKFIQYKYSSSYSLKKDCGQASKMTMRGEMFEFCLAQSKDPKLDNFWQQLNNALKN